MPKREKRPSQARQAEVRHLQDRLAAVDLFLVRAREAGYDVEALTILAGDWACKDALVLALSWGEV